MLAIGAQRYCDKTYFALPKIRMQVDEVKLKYWIDHFYGFGTWQANYWFISHEEGGGNLPEDVAERINYFYDTKMTSESLCDIREFYKQITFRREGPKAEDFKNLFEYRFEKGAALNNIWKNLVAFRHGHEGKKLPDLLTYQRKYFATNHEALIPLYPLPSPHNHAWYYSWLDVKDLPLLKSRSAYEDALYQSRIRKIFSNIIKYKPAVVLMYGMSNILSLKTSALDFFPKAKFKLGKAIKKKIPQHHRADLDGTTLIITTQIPTLRHNRIESGFEWEEFGKLVRS